MDLKEQEDKLRDLISKCLIDERNGMFYLTGLGMLFLVFFMFSMPKSILTLICSWCKKW